MNKNLLIVLGIIGFLLVAGISSGVSKYNTMVDREESVAEAWSQVENVYQRRADLIPNIVNTVKGYAKHEKSTFMEITKARAEIGKVTIGSDVFKDPEAMKNFQQSQNQLGGALSKLLVVSENYPELKADKQFSALITELEGSENRIAVERKKFNKVAKEYNTYIRKFPNSIFAGMFGFEKVHYFQADKGSDKVPTVKFD